MCMEDRKWVELATWQRNSFSLTLSLLPQLHLTFAVGFGQDQVTAKLGIGEANHNVLEDDCGISLQPEKFARILLSVVETFRMKGSNSGETTM